MKYFCIISFLLITVYHLTSPPIADATRISASLEYNSINGKQPMRGLISAAPGFTKKPAENKVVDGGSERFSVDQKAGLANVNVDDDGKGLIYNADYQGVTTHPPSPKHPMYP